MRSGSADDHRSQRRNGWFRRAEPQPVAEIVPERQAELLAGLHQPEHAVTRQPAVATDGAPGNLSLDDKAAQISFRRIGMQRRFRSLQNAQQFCLAAQSGKEFVEVAIPGSMEKIRSNRTSRPWAARRLGLREKSFRAL